MPSASPMPDPARPAGTVEGLAVRPRRHAPMQTVAIGHFDAPTGLRGDHRQRPGKRQVTVLAAEGWQDALDVLGVDLPWTTRRANVLVRGLPPLADTVGAQLHLGDVVLEVTGETDPCERMEAAQAGLYDALKPAWRGGVLCRIVRSGDVAVGAAVRLVWP